MLYRAHLQFVLLLTLAAGAVLTQPPAESKPLSKTDVFIALEAAKEQSQELIVKTNKDLITAIAVRGVDFVLTPEEEWQLGMRDASDELLAAIRDAVDPKEREARITADRQQRLYNEFSAGYNANDLSTRRAALTAAREFISLYASDQNVAEIITFMQRNLPRLEQSVAMMAQREEAMEQARAQANERQLRMEQERQERDRRRAEGAANAGNSPGNRTTNRTTNNVPINRTDTREDFPVVRQTP